MKRNHSPLRYSSPKILNVIAYENLMDTSIGVHRSPVDVNDALAPRHEMNIEVDPMDVESDRTGTERDLSW